MPNITSAKKRVRQNRKRYLRNRVRWEHLRKATKAFKATLAGGDATAIDAELRKVQRAVDKACTKGIIHKNTANRKKARLAVTANKARAATP